MAPHQAMAPLSQSHTKTSLAIPTQAPTMHMRKRHGQNITIPIATISEFQTRPATTVTSATTTTTINTSPTPPPTGTVTSETTDFPQTPTPLPTTPTNIPTPTSTSPPPPPRTTHITAPVLGAILATIFILVIASLLGYAWHTKTRTLRAARAHMDRPPTSPSPTLRPEVSRASDTGPANAGGVFTPGRPSYDELSAMVGGRLSPPRGGRTANSGDIAADISVARVTPWPHTDSHVDAHRGGGRSHPHPLAVHIPISLPQPQHDDSHKNSSTTTTTTATNPPPPAHHYNVNLWDPRGPTSDSGCESIFPHFASPPQASPSQSTRRSSTSSMQARHSLSGSAYSSSSSSYSSGTPHPPSDTDPDPRGGGGGVDLPLPLRYTPRRASQRGRGCGESVSSTGTVVWKWSEGDGGGRVCFVDGDEDGDGEVEEGQEGGDSDAGEEAQWTGDIPTSSRNLWPGGPGGEEMTWV